MSTLTTANVMTAMGLAVDSNLCITGEFEHSWGTVDSGTGCWPYWRDFYYPYVIERSYPVYVQERCLDRGKKAYELIKMLKDKKLLKITTVKQFVDLMDALIEML